MCEDNECAPTVDRAVEESSNQEVQDEKMSISKGFLFWLEAIYILDDILFVSVFMGKRVFEKAPIQWIL